MTRQEPTASPTGEGQSPTERGLNWSAFEKGFGEIPPPRRRPLAAAPDIADVPDAVPDSPQDAAPVEEERPLSAPTPAPASHPAVAGPFGYERPLHAVSQPAVPAQPTTAASPRVGPGGAGRLSATELLAQRSGQREATHVIQLLRDAGLDLELESSSMSVGYVELDLRGDADSQLDRLLEVLATRFRGVDVFVDPRPTGFTLWVPLAGDQPAQQRAVWVPAALRDRARAYQDATNVSVTQLLLASFNAYHSSVGDMFKAPEELGSTGPMRFSSARRRSDVDTPVQMWAYLKPYQEAQIDATVAETGAGSRSALFTPLLDHYLLSVGY